MNFLEYWSSKKAMQGIEKARRNPKMTNEDWDGIVFSFFLTFLATFLSGIAIYLLLNF